MALLRTSEAVRDNRVSLRTQDEREIGDLSVAMAAAAGEGRGVYIIRPFAVLSKTTYSAPITPPIGPAYLAATLEKAGYPVRIIDAIGEGIQRIRRSPCGSYNIQGISAEEIIAKIGSDAAIIGISMMFSLEWLSHRDLIKALRRACPAAVIVAGGEHPSAMPEFVLRDCPEIDFVVTGEGDLTFLELVHAIFYGHPSTGIPGICFIGASGEFISTGLSRRIVHIDQLPRPAWHLCDVDRYFLSNWTMGIAMGRNMPILATRGCPYQCTFCSSPGMWTTRYKMRDPSDVVSEIEDLVRVYRANSIDFFDLTAIVKKDWIIEFCRELKQRRITVTWQLPSGTRSEALDHEALQAIHDTGCRLLVYAPESGSEETLAVIKKKVKIDRITASIRDAVRIGHTVKVNLIVGFPHERLRHVLKTVLFAFRMALIGAEDCNIAVFSPYPGSELFEKLKEDGTIAEINDAYFKNLIAQFDFTTSASYCRHVPGWALATLRTFGQALFYATAYGTHPSRIVRVVRSIASGKFQASNLFEQRVFDYIARARSLRLTARPTTPEVPRP
jgi:anaerobic magnesium-protoporphyrin IX monomethyl ester cyclase